MEILALVGFFALLIGIIVLSVRFVKKQNKKKIELFQQWGLRLNLHHENKKQLLVPKGFAHGFQVLSNEAIVNYKVDNYYKPDSDLGIIWNDKDLSIDWNLDIKPILSDKDLKLALFKNLKSPF